MTVRNHFEIIRHVGVLSHNKTGWNKELNIVKWFNNEPKYDIRDWNPDHTKVGKGAPLTREELEALCDVILEERKYLAEEKLADDAEA